MAETGWPLIPREILPAPLPPATRSRSAKRAPHADAGRQLSIFGAETTEPSPFDLAGLLAGPGRLDRMGGTARVAVTVDAAWRVHVLVAELVSRGLVVTWRPIHSPLHDTPETHDTPKTQEEVRRGTSPPESGAHPHTGCDEVNPFPAKSPVARRPRPTSPRPTTDPVGIDPAEVDPVGIDPADIADLDPAEGEVGAVIGAAGRATVSAASEEPNGERSGSDGVRGSAAGDRPDAEPPRVVFEVRTAYSSRLNALARAWPAAADQLFLSGPRLRLWVAAAGRPVDGGYALGLGTHAGVTWLAVDAALRRAGLDAALSDHGLDCLITGRKRLARLAELVGERPGAAPAALWPGGAAA